MSIKQDYFSEDIKEFIHLLHKYEVKYLIVGGEAVIYYGYPRLTGDVDFFFSRDTENVSSLYNALLRFWDEDIPGIKNADELQSTGYVIQFGIPPNRIDLMNDIDGVTFNEAWKERTVEEIFVKGNKIPVYFLGLQNLIKNKRSSGRQKDLLDLSYLKKL